LEDIRIKNELPIVFGHSFRGIHKET